MNNEKLFQPTWASPPGETILDILAKRRLSEGDFANLMGLPLQSARSLLEGDTPISMSIARQLQKILGASMEFWMSRDFQYRSDIKKLVQENGGWISELPIKDMINFGWINPGPTRQDRLAACLRFFDVPNVFTWRQKYSILEKRVAFRESRTFDSHPGSVAAWLRQGEIQAEEIQCKSWNADWFRQSLLEMRSLTCWKDPGRFVPELQKRCAESGVAVTIVRAPAGCRASGATKFINPQKALLHLSFRYLTDDQFWFTFFHEAGHLILHGSTQLFLEGIETESESKEMEANEFAENILVPPKMKKKLLDLPLNTREVIRFSVEVGVSPGVVVGQLQHFNVIGRNHLNRLKRRFRWKS